MGDLGLIPGLGRFPGEGKGYPLQYSGLENSMDCIVHGVAQRQTHTCMHAAAQKFITCRFVSRMQNCSITIKELLYFLSY